MKLYKVLIIAVISTFAFSCNEPDINIGYIQFSIKNSALPENTDFPNLESYVVILENEQRDTILKGRELNIISIGSDSLSTARYELEPGTYTLRSCRILDKSKGVIAQAIEDNNTEGSLPTEIILKKDETTIVSPIF